MNVDRVDRHVRNIMGFIFYLIGFLITLFACAQLQIDWHYGGLLFLIGYLTGIVVRGIERR